MRTLVKLDVCTGFFFSILKSHKHKAISKTQRWPSFEESFRSGCKCQGSQGSNFLFVCFSKIRKNSYKQLFYQLGQGNIHAPNSNAAAPSPILSPVWNHRTIPRTSKVIAYIKKQH